MNKLTENKFAFLDRDGTIIKDRGYVHKIEDIKFLSGTIEGLRKIQSLGYDFVIVSNQAGVARGYYSLETAQKFNEEVIKRLNQERIKITQSYICPHHPNFTGRCDCRKPKNGMIEKAKKKFDIDFSRSIFIGDKDSDIKLGKKYKVKTFLIKNNKYISKENPDYKVVNMMEIFEILKKEN